MLQIWRTVVQLLQKTHSIVKLSIGEYYNLLQLIDNSFFWDYRITNQKVHLLLPNDFLLQTGY